MPTVARTAAWVTALSVACSICSGQNAPIQEDYVRALLPTGITEQAVELESELAYMFKDADGSDAVHLIGGATIVIGKDPGLEMRAREALVWLTSREYDGKAYVHLEVLLWREAEIVEPAGTATAGPALFVTFDSYGPVVVSVDEITHRSSADTRVYFEGSKIRDAIQGTEFSISDDRLLLRVFDPTQVATPEEPKSPATIRMTSPGSLTIDEIDGQQILTIRGGVYLSRGVPGGSDFLEIRSDALVAFVPENDPTLEQVGEEVPVAEPGDSSSTITPKLRPPQRGSTRQRMAAGFGEVDVEGVYIEGDVILTQGDSTIYASRVYYDFDNSRAVIYDAVITTTLASRNVPLYLRAHRIKQLSPRHYSAADAKLTTSDFHTPHYHVGAKEIEFINRSPADPEGGIGRVQAGIFRISHATLNVEGVPVAYWPHLKGQVDMSETAIRGLRLGYSDEFGAEIESDWQLFNILGLITPEGFDANFSLDYFSARGPATGVDIEYDRDTYFGLHRSYLMFESGNDILGRERQAEEYDGARGRFLWRHRQYLDDDWQVSFELSYISDEGFLEEFFEPEFDNEKEQETLFHVKKQRSNWAFTGLLQWRILDFTTQNESLPDFAFRWTGVPLTEGISYFSEYRAGVVRHRQAHQTFRELLRHGEKRSSGSAIRGDTRQELTFPLDVGPVRLVPFVSARGTAWDGSRKGGGLSRIFVSYGLRGSMHFWKVNPDFESDLFDIHGIRHIIKPDFVIYASHTNVDSRELYVFNEEVEGIDELDGIAIGLRQRFQTKRGEGDTYRTVDVLTIDSELGLFNDSPGTTTTNGYTSFSRPEESLPRNYFNTSMTWRINDQTALVTEANYDLNDKTGDIYNLSMVVERTPRLSYLLGYRYIQEEDSNLLAFDANYRFSEKHTLAVRELFDLDRGSSLDFTIGLIRKFPRWYAALSFELDEAEDDFGVSLSIWPEGMPKAALGSSRFTGLSQTTRVQTN